MVQSTMNDLDNDKCKRCGKCCMIYTIEGIWKKCRFLTPDNLCSIYKDRIGTFLSDPKKKGIYFFCGYRKDLGWDIPGCPYNTGKPIHPAYRDEETAT